MELTRARERIPNIDSAMAGQFAAGFATRYQQPYPQRQPGGGAKSSTEAAERFQQRLKAIPSEELLDAMMLVYQSYFTHSDIMDINELYRMPTGQKNTNAIMIGAIEAAQAVMNKHMPEIGAQIEKPAADTSPPALTRPQ